MKSAQIALWNSRPSTSGNGPNFYGSVQLPAALIAELAAMLQQGQGMEAGKDGEQVFRLRCSVWRRSGENNGPIASGEIETPTEAAAYQAKKAGNAAPGPVGYGAGPVSHASAQPPAPQPLGQPQWNGAGWVHWDGSRWIPCPPPASPPAAVDPPTAPPAGLPPGWGALPVNAAPAAAAMPPAVPPAGWGASQQFAPPMAAAPGGWGAPPAPPAQSW